MARPLEFDREQALDRAMETFWELGYEAASTATLLDRMGIARSSLYSTFGGKDELYRAALERYAEDLRRRVIAPLRREGPALETLERFFGEIAARGSEGRAPLRCCLLIRASLCTQHRSPAIAARVASVLDELDSAFGALLERARTEGTLRDEVHLETTARLLTTVFQGLNVAALEGREPQQQRQVAAGVLATLRRATP